MRSPTQSTVWRAIAWVRASKSNICSRYPEIMIRLDHDLISSFEHYLFKKPVPTFSDQARAPSAEAIGAIEVALDVEADRLLQRREAAVITGPREPIDIALGKILIAVADRWGHVDITNIRSCAERGIGRKHQILEAAGLAGADVEDARDRWCRQQPHHHPHRIVDIDEIAPLIAVGDAIAVRLEQFHDPAGPDVIETPRQHAHHRALVVFVGAEHVEEF